MNGLEKFIDISLPDKKYFYGHLSMEDIAEEDYTHAKRVCKDFEIKILSE